MDPITPLPRPNTLRMSTHPPSHDESTRSKRTRSGARSRTTRRSGHDGHAGQKRRPRARHAPVVSARLDQRCRRPRCVRGRRQPAQGPRHGRPDAREVPAEALQGDDAGGQGGGPRAHPRGSPRSDTRSAPSYATSRRWTESSSPTPSTSAVASAAASACTRASTRTTRAGLRRSTYIRVLEMDQGSIDVERSNHTYDHSKVPAKDKYYMPVQCHQCANPPCVKVCPIEATWQEPDGVTVVDYDWCIGCRYCAPRARTSRDASTTRSRRSRARRSTRT